MYMDVLRGIAGIGVFPVISLVLFVAVFGGVLLWAWRADGTRLDELAAIPLDAGSPGPAHDSAAVDAAPHRR